MGSVGEIIWTPGSERINHAAMSRFMKFVNSELGFEFKGWEELYQWSINDIESFWQQCAEFVGIKWDTKANKVLSQSSRSADEPTSSKGTMVGDKWFVGSKLNFARNLLPKPDDREVLISIFESGKPQRLTGLQLWNAVAACAKGLSSNGIGPGDRVAGVVANSSEAIIAMLGAASLGAVWSSCSPDFGVAGIVDRFSQISPKFMFFTQSYEYGGKSFPCLPVISGCLEALPSVKSSVIIDHLGVADVAEFPEGCRRWGDFLSDSNIDLDGDVAAQIEFVPTTFDAPLYIMFSSGTTGVPKCIIHGVGGTLLQHKKELVLHTDVGPRSKLLYYTTCGWMMWNWMASTLSTGATLVLYDGSPAYPEMKSLWQLVFEEKITVFGTSPKFIQACINSNLSFEKEDERKYLSTVLSTGSPLLPEHFEWVYGTLKSDLHLASISGGTDIVSCFMLGNPLLPVRIGEIQSPGLGMAVEAWNDQGQPVTAEKAELVCVKPFVSMPVGFWGDADGSKFLATYFEYFPNQQVWRHGDYIEISENGSICIHGRSDATLNPGGVRVGTAELYRQIEMLPDIQDSVAVGYAVDGDVDIILFLKLRDNRKLDKVLEQTVRSAIREKLTPRHVPKRIFQVSDIPYTRSGKKVEMAVKKAIHGEIIANMTAIANPEVMAEFVALGKDLPS